jgi:hypothetical protein
MNIGIGNIGLGGLGISPAELQRRIAQYQSGIGSVPAPAPKPKPAPVVTQPQQPIIPKSYGKPTPDVGGRPNVTTPIPYRGGPSAPSFGPKTTPRPAPVAPKPAPIVPVAPKPAITDARVPGAGIDYVAPKPTAKPVATTDPVTAKLNSPDPAIVAKATEDLRSMYSGLGMNNKDISRAVSPEVAKALEEPTDAKYTMGKYKDFLMSGTSKNFYDVIDDVDELDDFYNKGYAGKVLGGITKPIEATFTPEEYVDQTGSPEYLKGFKTVTNIADTKSAYGSIAGVDGIEDTSAVLSDHYGYDFNPVEEKVTPDSFGGNFETHSNATSEEISEFQSLVKPILKEQIPYLQATEGLSYQDALMEAYKRDPMLQSLYAKYDVTPVRQTKDGSTYLYDPMSFAEIRTKEVKDSSVQDALKMAAIIAASVYGGGFLANAFAGAAGAAGAGAGAGAAGAGAGAAGAGAGLGATIAGNAAASALITAATGGDMNDILKAAATAGLTSGVGAYAEGLSTAAETARVAAEGAEKGSTLFNAAEAAKNTADTFNKVVNTGKFITRAVDGDVAGAVIGQFGEKFTTAALDKVGLKGEFLAKYNINQDDLTSGLVKTQMELAKGTDFDNALVRGFGEYIKEGGALAPNDMKTPEFIKRIGDAIAYTGKMFDDAIFEPVKDATQPAIDAARAVGKKVDDKVFEPVKETVEAAGSAVDDTLIQPVRKVAKAADDTLIQPVREVGKAIDDTTKPVREGVSDVVKDVVKATGLGIGDVIALLMGGAGGAGMGGAGVRGGTPGTITEEASPLFKLAKEEEGQEDDVANFLASLTGNNPVVNVASGGMIQSSYGDLFDTIHQPKQTSDSTLNELLRIVGSR